MSSGLLVRLMAKDTGPTRPMNITSIYSSLAPVFSWLVTPTERPTVPKAEQDSKIASMTVTASVVVYYNTSAEPSAATMPSMIMVSAR